MYKRQGRYLVFEVRGARDGNPTDVPAQERDQLRNQLGRANGQLASSSYLKRSRARYTITVAEDRL